MPATGKLVTMSGISIYRVVEGKLVEGWVEYDQLGLMQQLGAVAGPVRPARNAHIACGKNFALASVTLAETQSAGMIQ